MHSGSPPTVGRSCVLQRAIDPNNSILRRTNVAGIFEASPWLSPSDVANVLDENHYLGASKRGFAWRDRFGVIVVAKCTARNLPAEWLELVRWCILSREKNAGSMQWRQFVRALRLREPSVTTLVSYSDPSVGHDGALYRACNWWWAPTWHRLRPPPTGNGSWKDGAKQSVKDRWVFPLRRDPTRTARLIANDASITRRFPELIYREPGGVPWQQIARSAA